MASSCNDKNLPMAEGDQIIIQHALSNREIQFGSFTYTNDFQLLSYHID